MIEAVAILQVEGSHGHLTAEALRLPVSLYNAKEHYDDIRDKMDRLWRFRGWTVKLHLR